ncbi:23S rRNA (adenine(1618)-N(6))-methyltransferase RlmF [Flavobacterium sp. SUN046]|uniref:23S rRNA (adenine(1618)-N(6))-methyltransferase RlmF n=1 Tax=Flavobacterium sp. SUN046 TaxID=3002440 RepID=UPI002DB69856|nr:23S rRNA (adenine(1618)-N(6))-methyltransferase RlmF [Flavobacterium sp. SUN046]MEC4048880.1 23S rRNA (adenine(1618)-N(6))-methyltransferase RlmF [Flavobacterium sp. SUN046]
MKNIDNNEKHSLHPRNLHRFMYDFDKLIASYPSLQEFVFVNEYQTETIDFSHPEAVKALNKALLLSDYDIQEWDIPANYLCPPIPGRADYIHYIADLLAESNQGEVPQGEHIIGLDVGIGANCIYPIIGNHEYGWSFVGTDIDEKALQNCKKIITQNPKLIDVISLQLQVEPRYIFKNIILAEDKFAFTICNPPFHSSKEEAAKAALRKVNNLTEKRNSHAVLNFGGQNSELWCNGGELGFITQMVYESVKYPFQCFWFTTLVSKKDTLKSIYKTLNKVGAVEIKTIEMAQGQKTSRFLAWTFLSKKQQGEWKFSV